MQEAIPYITHLPTTLNNINNVRMIEEKWSTQFPINNDREDCVKKMANENAVIAFARKDCCMTLVVKRLLQSLGVNPAVYEVEDGFEDVVVGGLRAADVCGGGMGSGAVQFPVVFIGGRWFGGLDRIMATHIRGELTPLLKQAGALWL